jgi:hypothetical protein
MAVLIAGYVSLEKLKQIVETLEMKKEKGFKFTAGVNDETNEYGQNVSFYAEQTEEQRKAKADRFFWGNGKVFWKNDAGAKLAEKKTEKKTEASVTDAPTAANGLPF